MNLSDADVDAAILARRREAARTRILREREYQRDEATATKSAPTKAEVDAWVAEQLKRRGEYEAHVCGTCRAGKAHLCGACQPKSDRHKMAEVKSKPLADMSDDELVNHLLEAAGSITKAAASAAQVVEGIERHRRARKSQGRGLSARDRGILADCQKSVRDLLAAARGLQAFARSILAADDAIKAAKANPIDFAASIAEAEASMKMAAEVKNMVRRSIERRAMYFDFSSN